MKRLLGVLAALVLILSGLLYDATPLPLWLLLLDIVSIGVLFRLLPTPEVPDDVI